MMNFFRLLAAFLLLALFAHEGLAAERRLAHVPDGFAVFHDQVLVLDHGAKLVYTAIKGGREYLVDGSTISSDYYEVRHPTVSPDRKHVAFSGGKKEHEFYRVVDGREIGPYTLACNPTFSPDSRLVAFEAKIGEIWHHALSDLTSSQVRMTPPAGLHYMRPVFSKDGRLLASIQLYSTERKAIRRIWTLGMVEVRTRQYESIADTVYSADRERVAYQAVKKGKPLVVTSSFAGGDEQEGKPFDTVLGPVMTPDGRHVAYGAIRNGKRLVVVDDRELPAPHLQSRPVLSADGASVAYSAADEGRTFVVVNGRSLPRYDEVGSPVFSADGAAVAYSARIDGKSFLAIDERAGDGRYDYVDSVRISPDGRYFAYRAVSGGKKLMALADRRGRVVKEGPAVDGIWEPSFVTDTRLGYAALIGQEFWWKELAAE